MNTLLLLTLLLTISFTQAFCTHDEDCLEGQCCVQHVCIDCNVLKLHRDKRNMEANIKNTKRIKRSFKGCPGCLGICMCYGDACVCIPVHDD